MDDPGTQKTDEAKRVITVALIEDNRLIREVLVSLLSQYPDLKIIAEGSNGETPLSKEDPHVVLLDFGLGKGDSLRVVEKVKKERPEAKVIVMDLLPVQEDLVDYVHAGVSGFIMKDATLGDLVHAIRAVAEPHTRLSRASVPNASVAAPGTGDAPGWDPSGGPGGGCGR
jgi:DNA-binding NarL/FixJ family response regulator